jgi:hypothetical protein
LMNLRNLTNAVIVKDALEAKICLTITSQRTKNLQ